MSTPAPISWFWAKLGQSTWPEKYHPLICHSLDVGNVAVRLWGRFRPPLQLRIASALGLDTETAGRWISFWIAAHDIGKLTPGFELRGSQTDKLRQQLTAAFDCPACEPKHHTETGTKVLRDELMCGGDNWPAMPELATKVAVAVGGHHGTFPTNWDVLQVVLGNENWASARREMLTRLASTFGMSKDTPVPCAVGSDQSAWMLLAGLTAVADWIGSNEEFFPWVGSPSPPDLETYTAVSERLTEQALNRVGWSDRAGTVCEPRGFTQSTDISCPRPLQERIIPLAEAQRSPQLFLIEAPMGEGKTEAAWYVADRWDRAGGAGTYVALPTMATSNQMFERVKRFLELAGGGNLMLLHGKAGLNDQFAELKRNARHPGRQEELYDDDKRPSGVVAEGWFANDKKQAILAPFGVGTIDQALLSVLQTKHGFVRLFGLAGKCVILDEVHAYDAYMTTLLERLLRWLAALGCPVVLLSATLPADKRTKLLAAYSGNPVTPMRLDTSEDGWGAYPRLVRVGVGDEKAEVRNFPADPSRDKKIRLSWVEDDDLARNIKGQLASGGCAAVIRNTVGLAQDTYLRLKEAFADDGEVKVELFHARFPFGRRKQIEDDVLEKYSKGPDGKPDNPKRPTKAILVATQVIEQSLDLDFDVMYTDVAPVDLVLQRAGRLHRHERGNRGAPCLWLIKPQENDGVPDFGPSEWVYDSHLLFRSWLALREVKGTHREAVRLPEEIEDLIGGVYADAEPPTYLSEKEQAHWTTTREEQKADLEREEEEAKVRQIKKPTFSGALARICDTPREEDDPSLHPAHQALTRLARPTVQLICLVKDSAGNRSLPHDGREVGTLRVRSYKEGGVDDLKLLVMAELSLSDGRVLRSLRDDPRRPTEWEKVGMLERHHLLEFVDGVAVIGDVALKLDNEIGLRVGRAGEEGDE